MIRRQVYYRGTVQGVGFRWAAVRTARQFRVSGFVRNLADGRVELVAEGDADEVGAFCAALQDRMSEYIRGSEVGEAQATGEFRGFDVAW